MQNAQSLVGCCSGGVPWVCCVQKDVVEDGSLESCALLAWYLLRVLLSAPVTYHIIGKGLSGRLCVATLVKGTVGVHVLADVSIHIDQTHWILHTEGVREMRSS